ncbi:MAG: hypothetical protein CVV00_02920 [Firmicutes bacterium HGW-Firmicutes-5]|nr:MAG: hypothetical protein CVV00_02920 [Firmicutes bacterium HGW-Firmicutes-5]
MKCKIYSYKDASILLDKNNDYIDFMNIIDNFDETELISIYKADKFTSISNAFRKYMDEKLINDNWGRDNYIFKDTTYSTKKWTNLYTKNGIALNFGFDHRFSICWYLMKGELDSRANYISKNGYRNYHIIITGTKSFLSVNGFDAAVGSYQEYIEYLKPFEILLNTPIILIGLHEFNTFKIQKIKSNGKSIGQIIMNSGI